jgi:hypothetical protein
LNGELVSDARLIDSLSGILFSRFSTDPSPLYFLGHLIKCWHELWFCWPFEFTNLRTNLSCLIPSLTILESLDSNIAHPTQKYCATGAIRSSKQKQRRMLIFVLAQVATRPNPSLGTLLTPRSTSTWIQSSAQGHEDQKPGLIE